MMNLFIYGYWFVFGTMLGSFINVLIERLPIDKSVITPRSACHFCQKNIPFYLNIPIISFCMLKGKSHCCHKSLPLQYLVIEAVIGFLTVILWHFSGQNLNTLFLFVVDVLILSLLLAHVVIDLKHYLLPDKINLALLALIVTKAIIHQLSWKYSSLGFVIGLLAPLSITYLFYKLRGVVGLGGGDIKLYAILGIYLGPLGIIHLLFLSSLLGSIAGIGLILIFKRDKKKPLPFGPAIIAVAMCQIYLPQVIQSVLRLLNFLPG